MKGKAIIAAAVVLLLLFTACSHGPETPAGISSETVTPSTVFVDLEPTTETVSPKGEVLGVTIGPGMMTSVKALFESAAQIPEIRLDIPDTVLGRDTVASIRAGVIYGFIGQLKGIVDQVEKEVGHKVVVIATGGFSRYLEGYIYVNKADVKHTLEGARIACLLNS